MATLNLGRVRLNFRGNFSDLNGITLEFFDAVTFAGSLYVVTAQSVTVIDTPAGNRPPTSNGQNSFLKITDGTTFLGEWQANTAYYKNQIVTYGSSSYIALTEVPDTRDSPLIEVQNDTAFWSTLASGFGNYIHNYDGTQSLNVYDIINYNGSLWITIAAATSGQTPSTNPALYQILIPGIGISGEWTQQTYTFRDSVTFHGKRYIVDNENGTNNQPLDATTGLLDTDWDLLTEGLKFVGIWSATSSDGYYPGDVIQFNNAVWAVIERMAVGESPALFPNKVTLLVQSAAFQLGELSDVDVSAVDNGSILQYENGQWNATDNNNDILLIPTGNGTVTVASNYVDRTNFTSNSLVPKSYVDSVVNGLNVKSPVRVATTSQLNAVYITTSQRLFGSILGEQLIIDDVTLNLNDRILVKDQINLIENGIYFVAALGNAQTPWELHRTGDADAAYEIEGGSFTFVQEGTSNAENGYVATHDGIPTINSDDIVFEQFSGAGQIQDGAGLIKNGNQLNVNVDNLSIEIVSDKLKIKNFGITNSMIANGTIDVGIKTTGTLQAENGGTGLASITKNSLIFGNNTSPVGETGQGSNGFAIYSNQGVPDWTNVINGGAYGLSVGDSTIDPFEGIQAVIKVRKSEEPFDIPTINDLAVGEIAINSSDRKIYVRDSFDRIVEIANYDVAGVGAASDEIINALIYG
jgi:hypothetical protein